MSSFCVWQNLQSLNWMFPSLCSSDKAQDRSPVSGQKEIEAALARRQASLLAACANQSVPTSAVPGLANLPSLTGLTGLASTPSGVTLPAISEAILAQVRAAQLTAQKTAEQLAAHRIAQQAAIQLNAQRTTELLAVHRSMQQVVALQNPEQEATVKASDLLAAQRTAEQLLKSQEEKRKLLWSGKKVKVIHFSLCKFSFFFLLKMSFSYSCVNFPFLFKKKDQKKQEQHRHARFQSYCRQVLHSPILVVGLYHADPQDISRVGHNSGHTMMAVSHTPK